MIKREREREREREPPLPEISEPSIKRNLAEPLLKSLDSDIVKDKPVTTTEKPTNRNNSLLTTKGEKNLAITNYQPRKLISKISLENHKEFFLNASEKTEISKRSLIITNQKEQLAEKEEILLIEIKNLKEQLKQVQTENNKLRIDKEKAGQLANQEKERADNYQQQLKTIGKLVYQWQKINYYRWLGQEAKVEQLLPPNFKK